MRILIVLAKRALIFESAVTLITCIVGFLFVH